MKNFYEFQSRHGKRFRYQNNHQDGKVVRIEVDYNVGGMNYSNYKVDPRGIYVSIREVNVEHRNGLVIESYGPSLKMGPDIFVEELARRVPSRIKAVAEKLDESAPALAELFEKDRDAAIAALVAKFQPPVAA
jgi:hypothetical protein